MRDLIERLERVALSEEARRFVLVKVDDRSLRTNRGSIVAAGSVSDLNAYAKKQGGFRFKRDGSLFGGYFVSNDGTSLVAYPERSSDKIGKMHDL